MYIVVSKWEALPGKEAQFAKVTGFMREEVRKLPGVAFVQGYHNDSCSISVVGYQDEGTYRRLIQDPSGPFEQAAAKSGLEECGKWAWSERGLVPDTEPSPVY